MRRVYVESVTGDISSVKDAETRIRVTTDRVLDRAALEFMSPVQVVSVQVTTDGTLGLTVVALVEEASAGFRPLGT